MRSSWILIGLALAAPAMLVACGGDDGGEPATPAECNPLGGAGCVTPWPSSIYLRDDAASPTGVRLDLAAGSWPRSADGIVFDPAPYNDRTGFSPASQLVVVFPEGVDPANLPFHDAIERSVAADSPTVILDLETGARIAHFAELDANARRPEEQALYLRPAARLAGGRRYAVAIRRTLRAAGGGELARPAGFRAILEGRATDHARLERVRPRYDAILAALEAAGIPRDDLVVAWDFVTADDESLLADTRRARDAALAAIGEGAANVTFTIDVDQAPVPEDAAIARKVLFRYTAPRIADDGGLLRDGSGAPRVDGTHDALAVALIPACASADEPAGILLFGHGFFGGLEEAQGGYLRRVARDLCVVVVGGVWWGMSQDDLAFAAAALNDLNRARAFGERKVQGVVDFMALAQLARGELATAVFVDGDGASLVDPERTWFYGISQGHILGTTFFAWDPHLTRAVLHVGGANWGVLFERSTNWVTFKLILDGAYPGPLNHVLIQQVLQLALDPTDPVHPSAALAAGGLPGTPAKQYLLHMSVGDASVTNLATMLQARTLGVPVLGPALFVPYGLEAEAGPLERALVIWTEEPSPLPPATNATSDQRNEAHERLRRRAAVVEQIGTFLETGAIVHTCGDGPCNCGQGACGPIDPP